MDRNRSEGWKYAKLSGHENEDLITELVCKNQSIQDEILKCAGKTGKIIGLKEGGLCEKEVPSVLGDDTKSKPDIKMNLDNGDHLNISIKKSWAGQVFLIQPERFLQGFEKQYNTVVPAIVKRAILLYFGKDSKTIDIINQYSNIPTIKKYELHKWRLTKDTLDKYDANLCSNMLAWFRENIVEIFDFCFVRGLAKNEKDWADVIWYKNMLSGEEDPDTLFNMKELKDKIYQHRDMVVFGNRNGGSTIQLPFGFLQYHNPPKDYPSQNCMQFHHNFRSLISL